MRRLPGWAGWVLVAGCAGAVVPGGAADPPRRGAAVLRRARQLIGAAAVNPGEGPFVAHLTFDLEVAVAADGLVTARVLDVRPCEDDGSGVCLSPREGNGTPAIEWNFQRARLWAEVPPGGLTVVSGGASPRLEVGVSVHLEGVGNQHTSPDWLGERAPAHGPGIPVTGEVTYRAAEHAFAFREHPALAALPAAAFRVGAPDDGQRVQGYELHEPCMHTRIHRLVGQAEVRRPQGDGWEPARLGQSLFAGDLLRTLGAATLVDVAVAPGHRVRLEGVATLRIPSDSLPVKVSLLELVTGVLWAKARRDDDGLRVATPNAICGVRGTSFRVRVVPGAETLTCVRVEEGAVEATGRDGQGATRVVTPADGDVCLLGSRGLPGTAPAPGPGEVPGPSAPAEVTLAFPEGGESQTAVLAPGGTLTVDLRTHGGTGATWAIARAPAAGEATLLSGPVLIPGPSTGRLGGGGGVTRWRYRLTAPAGGAFELAFELRQPWAQKPLRAVVARIQVAAPAPRGAAPGSGSPAAQQVDLGRGAGAAAAALGVAAGALVEVRLSAGAPAGAGAWSLEPAPAPGALALLEGPTADGPGRARVRLRPSGRPPGVLLTFVYRVAGSPDPLERAHLAVAAAPR